MSKFEDTYFMQRALELASRGRGLTTPNPMVGAVIVKNNTIISEGFHSCAGGDHAEIVALKRAGKHAKGCTLFVTLEPCCHVGRTGPCTDAIIKAGISKVIFAENDPDPRVKGKGERILKSAGIKISKGILKQQAKALNEVHYHYHKTGRPFITVKLAQSLDGRIATVSGDSKWISSPVARDIAHRLRAESDAVIIGAGTVVRDNPKLTVRRVKGPNPYRIIISRSLDFPQKSHLLNGNDDFKTIIASTENAINRYIKKKKTKNLIFWSVKTSRNGYLDIEDLLNKAASFGIKSILVEGGGKLATAFLSSGFVDRYIGIIAPILIGGNQNGVGDIGVRKIEYALKLERVIVHNTGNDIIVTGYPRNRRV